MSRISSQGTIIMVQSGAPVDDTAPITAVTKAAPAVLTIAASTAKVGDIVVPQGTGFASLDGRPFKVSEKTATEVTLEDSDTSKEAGTPTATGKLGLPPMLELCRSTFTVNNPAGATIDVTTLCDEAHRIVSGLPAIGTWQANGFYDYQDAAMKNCRDYYRSGEVVTFSATFRDGSGITFNGNVNLFDIAAGINAAVTNNLGGNIDGLVSMFAPPAGP